MQVNEPITFPSSPPEEPVQLCDGTELSPAQWTSLVARVQAGDSSGMADLYALISRGMRPYLARQLEPQDFQDSVHEIYVDVIHAIRQGQLREPERLMGFVRTVTRRKVAVYIDTAARNRRNHAESGRMYWLASPQQNPELAMISRQQRDLVQWTLAHLTGREADILRRFYLKEESPARIRLEMGLTETQFRLLKWRSKAHFEQLSRRKLVARQFRAYSANNSR